MVDQFTFSKGRCQISYAEIKKIFRRPYKWIGTFIHKHMQASLNHQGILKRFVGRADFSRGAVVLDLDGTAILEDRGKVFISGSVEKGVQEIVAIKRPVILNTLRFPLSVIRTVAEEWLQIYSENIPVVLLNGSQTGFIGRNGKQLEFKELVSFPLDKDEIKTIIVGLKQLLDENIRRELIVFYYPRDWKKGEIIWTPVDSHRSNLIEKYMSASEVISCEISQLEELLLSEDICMIFVLVDRPSDTLMAYQHSQPEKYFTRKGVDKSEGLRQMSTHLNISLPDSFGAGDTVMDSFLSQVGLAVMVGNDRLAFNGIRETVFVKDPKELGELILSFAQIVSAKNTI